MAAARALNRFAGLSAGAGILGAALNASLYTGETGGKNDVPAGLLALTASQVGTRRKTQALLHARMNTGARACSGGRCCRLLSRWARARALPPELCTERTSLSPRRAPRPAPQSREDTAA